jgi:hypothetical protein
MRCANAVGSEMTGSDFKTVSLSVRPARAAVLIDKRDTEWLRTCHRIIEWQSCVWGGWNFIIVPTDGTTISLDFWTLLEVYDPDYLLRYQPTWRDIKIANPQRYATILERNVAHWLDQHPEADPDFSRTQIDEQTERSPLASFEISDDLQQNLKRRLAPFHYEEEIVQSGPAVMAGSPAQWPFTPIDKIASHGEHPKHVFSPRFQTVGLMSLWISSTTGLLTPDAAAALNAAGVRVKDVEFDDDLVASAVRNWNGRLLLPGFDAAPFELSAMNVGHYSRSFQRNDDVVVVCGDTVDDFCLYYGLARVRADVVWFPSSWLTGFESGRERTQGTGEPRTSEESWAPLLVAAILRLPQGRYIDAPIRVTSASMGAQELQGLRQRIDRATFVNPGTFSRRATAPNFDALVANPLRAYERDKAGTPSVLQFVNGKLPGFIQTPKPRTFTRIDQEHYWITEVAVHQHQIPRHFALGPHVIRDPRLSTEQVRAGADGLAYFCPNVFTVGGMDVDTYLVRPTCILPDALEMFQHLASLNNMWCRPSSQGFFTQESAQKFENLATLAAALRNPVTRAIMEKYTDTTSGSGPDDGLVHSTRSATLLGFARSNEDNGQRASGHRSTGSLGRTRDPLPRIPHQVHILPNHILVWPGRTAKHLRVQAVCPYSDIHSETLAATGSAHLVLPP